jgi:3',5'-nucleoside bisphosphate phosphatase
LIDLHSHSTASDGQHSPSELVTRAQAAGVTILSVTDHDTIAGVAACQEAAQPCGLLLVPGIELTAFLYGLEVHLLGHFLDPTEPILKRYCDRLGDEREERMGAMVRKMGGLGFPVTMNEVRAIAGDAHLARPHLARLLVERRWCLSTKEAFDRFLGDGKPGWVERFQVSAEDAIGLVRGAGGTATLAHPGSSKVERHAIVALKSAGLDGLEVDHADQDSSARRKYLALARELNLVPTAGSDFHGEQLSPQRRLGTVSMDHADFEALRARAPR